MSAVRLRLGYNRTLFYMCVVKNLSKFDVENILYDLYIRYQKKVENNFGGF